MKDGKKVRRGTKGIILLAGVAVAAGGMYGLWYMGISHAAGSDSVVIQAGTGEEVVYGQLTAVRGNEITYLVAEEMEGIDGDAAEGPDRGGPGDVGEGSGGGGREGFEAPGTEQGGGNFQADGSGSVELPGTGELDAQGFPTGGMPDFGGMGGGLQEAGTDISGFSYEGRMYRLTDTERMELIPVGTEVVTKLGTVTTFSRLAAGDHVAVVRDKESGVITAVYIIG